MKLKNLKLGNRLIAVSLLLLPLAASAQEPARRSDADPVTSPAPIPLPRPATPAATPAQRSAVAAPAAGAPAAPVPGAPAQAAIEFPPDPAVLAEQEEKQAQERAAEERRRTTEERVAAELDRRQKLKERCVIKPVMSDEEIEACRVAYRL